MHFILNCFAKEEGTPPHGAEDTDVVAPTPPPAPPAPPPPPPPKLTLELLQQQDAKTSSAIIKILSENKTFISFGMAEADDIISRDDEDGIKLQAGVQISIDKGVLTAMEQPPQYKCIDVIGKSPDDICKLIMNDMGSAVDNGGVVVLCGLSGTGKGTTVARLKEMMPSAVTWSNGNIFRSLTLLAVTWCELFNLPEFDANAALSDANLAGFMKMMSFGKFNDKWDIQVKGLGLNFLVNEVSNTLLKEPKVGKHIPTVAERTQGEVVNFAAEATRRMGEDGIIVLLEGRQQTVDYVPTPYRYNLEMSDTSVLGQRRAAQRLGAAVFSAIQKVEEEVEHTSESLGRYLLTKLDEMAFESGVAVLEEETMELELTVDQPMGLTVREIEPENYLLVTAVDPNSQGCKRGGRIGYFIIELDGTKVFSLDDVFARLKDCRESGRRNFKVLLSATPPKESSLDGDATSPISDLADVSRGESLRQVPPPLVMVGPSGVGKSTLMGRLLQSFPGVFGFSVSHTTRAPRPGEVDGRDYNFISKEDMEEMIRHEKFLEHATVHGNMYGTSIQAVKAVAEAGKVCILDIDVQGCQNVKRHGTLFGTTPHYVFIAPPSLKALEERLIKRGTETKEKLALRLKNAEEELKYGAVEGNFDFVMVNKDLEKSYDQLVTNLLEIYPAVSKEFGSGDIETPEQFLIRIGLGDYVAAFLKFGVETMEDVETSARLLSDEELSSEIGMSDEDIAHFREVFEDSEEDEDDYEDDEEDDDL
jgi:guanylate kinase